MPKSSKKVAWRCPFCSQEYFVPAGKNPSICPECRPAAELSKQREAVAETEREQVKQKKTEARASFAAYVFFFLVMAGLIWGSFVVIRGAGRMVYRTVTGFLPSSHASSSSSESTTSADMHEIEAWSMAQSFVLKSLKSPSTADFGSVFGDYQDPKHCVVTLPNRKFRVSGWVDAQNSFGATLRTRFMVTISASPDYQTWKAVEGPILIE